VVNGLETKQDGDEWVDTVWSSEGVRQGDPLGPLLFSIAMRGVLEEFQLELGQSTLNVAYSDDVYVLSPDTLALDQIKEFFRTRPQNLTLNGDKSKMNLFADIRSTGVAVLGSFVGPRTGREAFLRQKMDVLASDLAKLVR
jgi:hypothetical protein